MNLKTGSSQLLPHLMRQEECKSFFLEWPDAFAGIGATMARIETNGF